MRRSTSGVTTMDLGRMARILTALVLSVLLFSSPRPVQAQTWNGSVSDLWSNASNWTPNLVPNSSTANVTITNATNNPILIDISPTIANLTLGASNSLTIGNNTQLTVAGGGGNGTLDNAGTITLGSTGNTTYLQISGTVTNTDGGSITLSNQSNRNIIYGSGGTLINDTTNTIQGAGVIGDTSSLTINNKGTIDANVSNSLTINPSIGMTNTGTLEATAGATLNLPVAITNTGGTILSTGSGSAVSLAGGSVTGGTLTTTSGGAMYVGGSTLSGVTISTGTTATVQNNSTVTVGGTLTNNGTLALASTANGTFMQITGTVTNTGGGSITMSNQSNQNQIYGSGGTLINDTANTIQGAGVIGDTSSLTINNKGTIDANVSNSLTINPSIGMTNTGTLEATAGATLNLPVAITNTGGTIVSTGAGSIVNLAGGSVTGGTLTTTSGGAMYVGGSTLSGVTISTGTTATVQNNSTVTVGGTLTNNGTLALASTANGTFMQITGTVTNTGGGSITMSNQSNQNQIYGSGGTLINDTANTIQGAGVIGDTFSLTINNKGTIDANVSNSLTINPSIGMTNTGTLEATAGATLNLPVAITNTGGTIVSTGAGSIVNLASGTMNGGTLTTASGGAIYVGDSTLNGVTISTGTTATVENNSSVTLAGTLTNNGTLALASTANNTLIQITGTVTNTGGGSITMSNQSNQNYIYGTGGTLINDTANTIQGAGVIGDSYSLTVNNKGTINANDSNSLTINPSLAVTNTGLLEATSGGTLLIPAAVNNTGGTILSTGAGSVVNLYSGTVNGGTLTTQSGGAMYVGNSTLSGVTLSTGSTANVENNTTLTLAGTINNQGNIAVNSTGNTTYVTLSGNVTLEGGGTVLLSNQPNQNFIYGTATLTNINNTIQGSGVIGDAYNMPLVNQAAGTILANQSNALTINTAGSVTNNGTFQADSGSSLIVTSAMTNFTTPTTLTGGTYNVYSGTIQLPGNVNTNAATILLDGATGTPSLLNGSGTNALANFGTNAAAGHFTIQNGVSLTSASTGFTNAGTMNIGATSTFTVGGSNDFVQTGGTTFLVHANSILAVHSGNSVDINGGTLQGFGTVQGNLVNAGIVHPGDGPGLLSVTGTYTQTSAGALNVDIAGANPGTGYSQLVVNGASATLDGTLNLSLLSTFQPTNGETFVLLTSNDLIGTFATISGEHQGDVTFSVAYSPTGFPNDVVLTAMVAGAVPEPASLVMLATGLVGVGAFVARKRRGTSAKVSA